MTSEPDHSGAPWPRSTHPDGPPDPRADYWTTTDVARYLGVALGTVSTYVTRKQMPLPDRQYGRARVWKPARIIEWHQGRPKAPRRRRNPETP